MTHPIDTVLAGEHETLGTEFWVKFDEAFMGFCSDMAILQLNGWRKSTGVARERQFFEDQQRPIYLLDPNLPNYGLAAKCSL
jgi:Domain of unknown function (DUF1937)